jgi:hypothetical protein
MTNLQKINLQKVKTTFRRHKQEHFSHFIFKSTFQEVGLFLEVDFSLIYQTYIVLCHLKNSMVRRQYSDVLFVND